jgi:hypothetical protein
MILFAGVIAACILSDFCITRFRLKVTNKNGLLGGQAVGISFNTVDDYLMASTRAGKVITAWRSTATRVSSPSLFRLASLQYGHTSRGGNTCELQTGQVSPTSE